VLGKTPYRVLLGDPAAMPFVIAPLLLRLFPGVARTLVRLVGLLVLIGIAAALMS
jgi:hypothetical protein